MSTQVATSEPWVQAAQGRTYHQVCPRRGRRARGGARKVRLLESKRRDQNVAEKSTQHSIVEYGSLPLIGVLLEVPGTGTPVPMEVELEDKPALPGSWNMFMLLSHMQVLQVGRWLVTGASLLCAPAVTTCLALQGLLGLTPGLARILCPVHFN